MRTEDFEKAIDGLSVHGLEIMEMKINAKEGGKVNAVYGRLGELTFIKWDEIGRGFSFEQPSDMEGSICSNDLPYLDYKRDSAFDLRFE